MHQSTSIKNHKRRNNTTSIQRTQECNVVAVPNNLWKQKLFFLKRLHMGWGREVILPSLSVLDLEGKSICPQRILQIPILQSVLRERLPLSCLCLLGLYYFQSIKPDSGCQAVPDCCYLQQPQTASTTWEIPSTLSPSPWITLHMNWFCRSCKTSLPQKHWSTSEVTSAYRELLNWKVTKSFTTVSKCFYIYMRSII